MGMNTLIDSRRRLRSDVEMDITPMIDMTFLLLIFFLVASKMDRGNELRLPEARNGTAVTEKTSAVLSLQSAGTDRARLYLGERLVPEALVSTGDPARDQEAIMDYVRRECSSGKTQVLIRAEKSVKHRDVDRIMKAIAGAADVPIFVAVLEHR